MAFTPSQVQLSPSVKPIWGGQAGASLLIYNPDAANTVYLGGVSGISVGALNTLPLGPGQSVVIDGSQAIYGTAPTGTAATVVIPGGAAFFLGLTQAQGALAIASIHSPNFAPGVAGWSFNKDGTFQATGGTIVGGNEYWYNGPAGPGTLAFSIAGAPTVDQYGNSVLAGYVGYQATSAMQLSSDGPSHTHRLARYTAASQAGPWVLQVEMVLDSTQISISSGLLQAFAGVAVTGGATTDTLNVTSTSTFGAKETITAGGLAVTGGTTTDTLTVNGETTLTPVVMSGHPVIEQPDQSVIPVVATSNSPVTTAWSIPANDAQAGTVYRLKAGGYGVQGSTQETLRIQLSFMGLNIGSDTLPATVIPASAQFEWTFEGTVSVVSNGAAGKARATGEFKIWELNGPASDVLIVGQHTGVADSTVNTTVAQTMSLGASWGSATGAPTITGAWSTLARVGP